MTVAKCEEKEKRMYTKEEKRNTIEKFATHEGDTGSPEVQVAVLTAKINNLAVHLKANNHDQISRKGLLHMVAKRHKLLKYLRITDENRYLKLIEELGLRK